MKNEELQEQLKNLPPDAEIFLIQKEGKAKIHFWRPSVKYDKQSNSIEIIGQLVSRDYT